MGSKRLSVILSCLLIILFLLFAVNIARAITISPVRFDDLVLKPGSEVNKELTIYNEDKISKVYTFDILNFTAANDSGSPKFLPGNYGLASWISLPFDKITLGPDEIKKVSFKIAVPQGAKPGGYYAAVFLVGGAKIGRQKGNIKQQEKIGALILGSVPGKVERKIIFKKLEIMPENKKFFSEKPPGFSVLLENQGDIHSRPDIKLAVSNFMGSKKDILDLNPTKSYILPHSERKFRAEWNKASNPSGFWGKVKSEFKNFSLGRYKATLVFKGKAIGQGANGYVAFWVIPWHLLLVILVLVICLFLLIRIYNKKIIKKAANIRG